MTKQQTLWYLKYTITAIPFVIVGLIVDAVVKFDNWQNFKP